MNASAGPGLQRHFAEGEGLATLFFQDREFSLPSVKVLPNQYFVTRRDMMLTTVLGSCVAACLRDPVAGVAGLNHFMLPDNMTNAAQPSMRYGKVAMDVMIEHMLRDGARIERIEAKVFGGGAVLANMTMLNIGDRNADFVERYLQQIGIAICARDLRGNAPRRVNYFAADGKALVRRLARSADVPVLRQQEEALLRETRLPLTAPEAGQSLQRLRRIV